MSDCRDTTGEEDGNSGGGGVRGRRRVTRMEYRGLLGSGERERGGGWI